MYGSDRDVRCWFNNGGKVDGGTCKVGRSGGKVDGGRRMVT